MSDVLALIPARGGSRGIARKNARPFLGRPLVAWAVEAATASDACTRVIVSTDDDEIAALARDAGAESPFVRPAELSTDEAPTAGVVRHALEWLAEHDGWHPDRVLILEPTSPARRPRHVREAAALLERSGADSIASVSAVPHHYVPEKVLTVSEGEIAGADGMPVAAMTHRRQDLADRYAFDGIIFGCTAVTALTGAPTIWGERVAAYIVDRRYAVDIDEPEDWPLAELLVQRLLDEEAS